MADRHQEAARHYVQTILDATGLDASTLARRVGLTPSTLTRFLNDARTVHSLSARTLSKLADYSQMPLPRELGGAATASDPSRQLPTSKPLRNPEAGPRDLPVLGFARAGEEGFFIENGTVQRYVERPWFLIGRSESYSVYVSDDSMEPVFRHGQLLYVDPGLPVGKEDDVVIQLRDGQAFVKRFLRKAGGSYVCRQYNPDREIEYPANDVRSVHLVLASLRVRG
jgi:phage repressor protein C with HTH and peptisase S24 domain